MLTIALLIYYRDFVCCGLASVMYNKLHIWKHMGNIHIRTWSKERKCTESIFKFCTPKNEATRLKLFEEWQRSSPIPCRDFDGHPTGFGYGLRKTEEHGCKDFFSKKKEKRRRLPCRIALKWPKDRSSHRTFLFKRQRYHTTSSDHEYPCEQNICFHSF